MSPSIGTSAAARAGWSALASGPPGGIERSVLEFRLRMKDREIANLEAEIRGISENEARDLRNARQSFSGRARKSPSPARTRTDNEPAELLKPLSRSLF